MAKKPLSRDVDFADDDEDSDPAKRCTFRNQSRSSIIVLIVGGFVFGLINTAVLAKLLLPSLSAAREPAKRAQCVNNLKQIGLALHNYHDAHNAFPDNIKDAAGQPLLSWRVVLLPYLEEEKLYSEFHLNEPWDSPHNQQLLSRIPYCFRCPSEKDLKPGETVYQSFAGPQAMMDGKPTRIRDFTDGISNTIVVAESNRTVPWSQPADIPFTLNGPSPSVGSAHPGGFNALLGDGSVKHIKSAIPPGTLRALITKNGDEQVSP